jgi:nucleotide-binding universal stress UspA family protein
MYKHILVSTDGSKLSDKAINTAFKLAAAVGAKVTGLFVVPPHVLPVYSEGMIYARTMSKSRYRASCRREGRKALAAVEIESQAARVPYGSAILAAENPWEGIVRAAKAKKCDLIVMASHGRRGLAGLLLGSETTKVLTHSRIPVLVCR